MSESNLALRLPAPRSAQQSAFTYLRHGQTPFFRLPCAELERPGAAAYAGAGAVLLGVPYDGGATHQPGARLAPYHVRRVSAFLQTFHPFHEVDVFGALGAIDGGNVAFPPFDPPSVRELVQGEVARVLAAGAAPFLLGGDHSIVLPALRAIAARHGPVAVVHVDAHLDTSDGEVWGCDFHHGTPLRHALVEGLIERGQLHQVGIRASFGAASDLDLGRGHGARVYLMDEVASRGVTAIASDVRSAVGLRNVYLTFDVDAVDPAFAPGTGTPVPGGLTSREAVALLRGLAGVNLVGMDVVEVAPPLDHADLTSNLAAHLLYEGLALAALRMS
ncbi:MAG: agmatinase [Thermodesulfobacteriota bacterium]